MNEWCHVHEEDDASKWFDAFKSAANFIKLQYNANLDATSTGAPPASPHAKAHHQLRHKQRRTTSFATKESRHPAVSTFSLFRKQFIFQFDLRKNGETTGVWKHRIRSLTELTRHVSTGALSILENAQ